MGADRSDDGLDTTRYRNPNTVLSGESQALENAETSLHLRIPRLIADRSDHYLDTSGFHDPNSARRVERQKLEKNRAPLLQFRARLVVEEGGNDGLDTAGIRNPKFIRVAGTG